MIALSRSLPKIHDHKWEWGQKLFWKWRALPFFTLLVSWHLNSAKLALLHSPCQLGYLVLRLTFRHSWIQFQDTWSSLPASVSLHSLATRTDQGFLKDEVPLVWQCLFSFRRCCMHLQSYLIGGGGQIPWRKAESNHQLLADNWFCYFQLWNTHQLGCICRSNSSKQWNTITKLISSRVDIPPAIKTVIRVRFLVRWNQKLQKLLFIAWSLFDV